MDGCHQMKHRCETTSAAYHDSSPARKEITSLLLTWYLKGQYIAVCVMKIQLQVQNKVCKKSVNNRVYMHNST